MQEKGEIMLTGDQLRIVRTALGLSGQDMAEIMYRTKQQISSIETGKSNGKKGLNYYTLAIKEVIRNLEDSDKRTDCIKLIRIFESD